jgi:hypothetical protein
MAEADVINSLTEINKTLRRNVAVNIRTYRNVIGLRKDMKPSARDDAIDDLDERRIQDRGTGDQQSSDRGKVAKEARKGFFSSFLKWFGLLGLGVFLKDEIGGFISGAFGQLKEYISDWWEKTGKPAFSKFSDSIGLTKLMDYVSDIGTSLKEFAYSIPGVKALSEFLFGKEAEVDDSGNLISEGTEGLFGPIAKYAKNFGDALVTLGKDLGLLNEDGSISTGGALVGAGALAALFTFIGPASLIKMGLKGALGIFSSLGSLLLAVGGGFLQLSKFLVVKGILDPALWVGKKALHMAMRGASAGFLSLATSMADGGPLQNAFLRLSGGAESLGNMLSNRAAQRAGARAATSTAASAAAGALPAGGFSRGMASIFAAKFIIPLLAVGALAGAVYGLYKLSQKEDERRSQQVAAAEASGLYSQEQLDYAKQEAEKRTFESERGLVFKDDEDAYASGAGTFEQYLAARDETKSTGTSLTAKEKLKQQIAAYDKERKKYEASIEEERVKILNSLIDSRKMNQRMVLNKMLIGPVQRMIGEGIIEFDKGLKPADSIKTLMKWMEQPENTGKPMTLDILKSVGGMRIVDPDKQFTMLDRKGEKVTTTLGDVTTLEELGYKTGILRSKSLEREKLEAFGKNQAGAKVGALNDAQKQNRQNLGAVEGALGGVGDINVYNNNGGRGDSAGPGSVTAVVNERQRYTQDATGKVNLFGWQGR